MNRIPIIGWLLSFVLNLFLSLPFWFIWTVLGIGEKFFSFLPEAFHSPGFWSVVGLFICLEIIRNVLLPSGPFSASTGHSND